jgi:putative ABC transport system permease protein
VVGVRLAVRALWFRRGVSLVVLLVASVAVAAAALGPVWSSAAQESLLRDRLATEAVGATGLSATRSNATSFDPLPAEQLLEVTARALADPAVDDLFGPVRSSVRLSGEMPLLGTSNVTPVAVARLAWREGQCELLRFTEGRCPQAVGEVVVSKRTVDSGVGVGLGPLRVQLVGSDAVRVPRVVGVYEPVDPDDPAWFSVDYFDAGPRPGDSAPPKVDTVFASRPTFDEVSAAGLTGLAERPLRPDAVELESAGELGRDVDALVRRAGGTGQAVTTSLPDLLADVRGEQDEVRTAALVVAAQLLLLAAAVLQLVLAGATEDRAGEVALARLRGSGPLRTLASGLLEPVLLLLLAAPLGVLLALGAGQLLVSSALREGTRVALSAEVLAAAGVAVAAGAVAAVVAGRRVLTAPVLTVLRREGGRPSAARGAVVEAVVVALAGAATFQLLADGGDSGLALLAPALLSLAVALVGVRVVPLLAAVLVRRTRWSPRPAGFLAVRQVARRPQQLRVVVLLAVAVALALFAVDGWLVAADNRQRRADLEVGASTVLRLAPVSVPALREAVAVVDPVGDRAMAVLESTPGGQSAFDRFLAVDAERLAATSAWDPTWTGLPAAAEAARLRPDAPVEQVRLDGRRLELDLAARVTASEEPARVAVVVRGTSEAEGTVDRTVPLGLLRSGTATYAADLPADCEQGCSLRRFVLDRSGSGRVAGDLLLSAARLDGSPLPLPLTDPRAWRGIRVELYDDDVVLRPATTAGPDGLRVAFDSRDSSAAVAWTTADVPERVPLLVGPEVRLTPYAGDESTVAGISPDGTLALFEVLQRAEALPRVGRAGVVADLAVVDRVARLTGAQQEPQVWLAPGVDPEGVAAALGEAGLEVRAVERLDERRRALDQEGPALALLLLLVSAAAALALAVVAVSAALHDAGRSRAPELSSLRALGVGRRALVGAAVREQVGLLGVGLVLGTVAGAVAVQVALPRLPVAAEASGLAPSVLDPVWPPLLGVVGATALAVVVVAVVSARLVVRAAGLQRSGR